MARLFPPDSVVKKKCDSVVKRIVVKWKNKIQSFSGKMERWLVVKKKLIHWSKRKVIVFEADDARRRRVVTLYSSV